jgi:hypothetical protein
LNYTAFAADFAPTPEKVNFTPEHAMKTQRGNRGIAIYRVCTKEWCGCNGE